MTDTESLVFLPIKTTEIYSKAQMGERGLKEPLKQAWVKKAHLVEKLFGNKKGKLYYLINFDKFYHAPKSEPENRKCLYAKKFNYVYEKIRNNKCSNFGTRVTEKIAGLQMCCGIGMVSSSRVV